MNPRGKKKKNMPSQKEIFDFLVEESHPYRFEFVPDMQPMRVSVEERIIYANADFMVKVVGKIVGAGLDWKQIMKKNIKHEKTHERYLKWNVKWGVGATAHGWLASFLTDIVIDRIHFRCDKDFQKWLHLDSRHVYEDTARRLEKRFPNLSSRPHFLYTQAAYWISIKAITLEEAVSLYPERVLYIMELSQLFDEIKSEGDLEWAYPKALRIYFANFKTL